MRRQVGTFPDRTSFPSFPHCFPSAPVLSHAFSTPAAGLRHPQYAGPGPTRLEPSSAFSRRGVCPSAMVIPCGQGPCLFSPCNKHGNPAGADVVIALTVGPRTPSCRQPGSLLLALLPFLCWKEPGTALSLGGGSRKWGLCLCSHLPPLLLVPVRLSPHPQLLSSDSACQAGRAASPSAVKQPPAQPELWSEDTQHPQERTEVASTELGT